MSQTSHPLIDTLRRVPLFNELTDTELASVAGSISVSRFDAGQMVFCEGDRGGDLLVIKEGSVKILKTAASGRHQLISIERAGSSLGEVSAFDGGNYSTTAVTITPAILLRLNGERFRDFCLAHPGVSVKVIRVLGHRLRHLRSLVEELAFATVRDRVIRHLLRMAEERGVRGDQGTEIDLHENNEELAERLGTVRELVSRNLGRLHGEGLIIMRRRAVAIPDEALLRAAIEK